MIASGVLQTALLPTEIEFITSSINGWTPRRTGLFQFWCFGAIGGGGAARIGNVFNRSVASGGGGGAVRTKLIASALLTDTFNITIGAGGAGASAPAGNFFGPGSTGGQSLIVRTALGLNMIATGGAGGQNKGLSGEIAAAAAGGTASGGDYNYPGGRSRSCQASVDATTLGSSGGVPNLGYVGWPVISALLTTTSAEPAKNILPAAYADLVTSGFPLKGYNVGFDSGAASLTKSASGGTGSMACGGGGHACNGNSFNGAGSGGLGGNGLVATIYYGQANLK